MPAATLRRATEGRCVVRLLSSALEDEWGTAKMRGQRGFPAGRTVPEGLWVEGPWQEHLTRVFRLPCPLKEGHATAKSR